MLNLHCNKNGKNKQKKKKKKSMGSKSTEVSTTLWRPMELTDKNNKFMLKL